jgi:glycosyltransferase involved in cell wall biosynthesis
VGERMKSIEKELRIIHNFKYMINGYGLCALEKMIPADIPVLFIQGQLSDSVLVSLKKIMNKCCIIGVGEAALFLLEKDIKVDFIYIREDIGYERFGKNTGWERVPLIVDTAISTSFFERHQGRKFFVSSGSKIETYLFEKIIRNADIMYHYNSLAELPGKSLKEDLLFMGDFLGGSGMMILEENIKIYKDSVLVKEINFTESDLEQYFTLEVDVERILSWLIQLFDQKARACFGMEYNGLPDDFDEVGTLISKGLGYYELLYEMAQKGSVEKTELDVLVNSINDNTGMLDTIEYILYLIQLADSLDTETEKEASNEIARTAADTIIQYKKMLQVIEMMRNGFLPMKETQEIEFVPAGTTGDIENVLLMFGGSSYSAIQHFAEGLKRGFQRRNIVTYMSEINDAGVLKCLMRPTGYNHFQKTIGYQYIILLNGTTLGSIGYDNVSGSFKDVFDNRNSKIIPFLLDHPIHHRERLMAGYSFYAVLLGDEYCVKFMQSYMKDIPEPVLLQTGGNKPEKEGVEFAKRHNKIVFFGSYNDISKLEKQIDRHEFSRLIRQIIELLKADTGLTIEAAVDLLEEEKGTAYTIHHIVFQMGVFEIIERYIRCFFRTKVLESIIQAGLPIDIYGWKQAPYGQFPNVTLKDPVPFDEMEDICGKVRFVLNVQPWCKAGTQERVFNAMLCGAVAITDGCDFLREQTVDGRDLILYELDGIEQLPDKIHYYMEHEEAAEQIAANGNKLALENHTWEHRAEELVEYLRRRQADADN